jgi:hypothetical protein
MFMQEMRNRNMPVIGCKFDFNKRKQYLLNLRKILEDKRLGVPRGPAALPYTDELFYELTSMFPTSTPGGLETFETSAEHDDMVMSLALSLMAATTASQSNIKPVYSK